MHLGEMHWMDVEKYLQRDNRIMIIIGSCEQHGYLSLQTDVKIPLALADAASRSTGVVIAPPVNFGISPYFLAYPGTISLRTETLLSLIEDIVSSLYQSGFRKMLFLNGHGGNAPGLQKVLELINRFTDLKTAWYSWWESHTAEMVARKHQLKPYHASWSENFPFVRVDDIPDGNKIPPAYQGLLNAQETRETFGDGVFGGLYQAEDHIMQEFFNEILKDVLHLLDF